MAEMEDALRSCMERLVIAREEREQIIIEAANEISSEKKKARELHQKLEESNTRVARLAAENSHLRKAVESKDALVGELRQSSSATASKLADATAGMEAAQKQAASAQYEVRMLQKELEVRGQEREYDLRSADAARLREAEHLKRIAHLEAECQRLRAMVRKRLPGPAAIAKMRDEVTDQQQIQIQTPTASPRRPRPAAAATSPRRTPSPSPRQSVSSDAEGYAFRLRAVEEENRALKQALAKRESELQLVKMEYADEASRLTVAQRQLKELTEENMQLSDANSQSESWASALISELDKFRSGNNQNGSSVMASSEMNLLDDFAEIEKLEMASGDQKCSGQRASPKKVDTAGLVTQEQNVNGPVPVLDGGISNGYPEKVKDIWEVVVHRHKASGESVETIIEQIRQALDQAAISPERDDSGGLNDRPEIEKVVRNMVEEISSMIHTYAAEDDVARSRALLHNKSELLRRLEHLVQVCHDLLEGKCNLGKFIDEVCLTIKYIVSQYFSDQDHYTANINAESFDGVKPSSRVTANGTHYSESAKPAATSTIQTKAEEEPVQSVESQIMASHHLQKPDTELIHVIQAQDDSILPGRKSTYYEIKSPAPEANVEHRAAQTHEESHLATNSEILAAADKLAECQETITILSKQLQALKMPTTSGPQDSSSICNPRPSSAASDFKPQSLASILADEFADANSSMSPITPRQQMLSKTKDEGEVCATPLRSGAATPMRSGAAPAQQEENAGADDKDPLQIVVHPVVAAADPKRKKKRGTSLLGRIMFRK